MAVNPINEIASNIVGFQLARMLDDNTLLLNNSLQRLTSGLRILNAGDDPSGVAIAAKINSETGRINTVSSAIDNTKNYVQSQSDFLTTVATKLSRMSDLAVLSQSSSTTADVRSSYQIEFEQIQSFISDVSRRTFNSQALFGLQTSALIDQDGSQFTLQAINYNAVSTSGGINDIFVSTVSISTTTAAVSAQNAVSVATQNLGILQSRISSNSQSLTDYKSLLTTLSTNLQKNADAITATNTTSETVEFNRLSLLTQTGQTMLANYETLRLGLLNLLKI